MLVNSKINENDPIVIHKIVETHPGSFYAWIFTGDKLLRVPCYCTCGQAHTEYIWELHCTVEEREGKTTDICSNHKSAGEFGQAYTCGSCGKYIK